MKTLIFSLVFVLFAGLTNAQEITELKEARVDASTLSPELIRSGDNFSYTVKETSAGEFEKDPLSFVKTHFNIQDLISEDEGKRYSYFVIFKSNRGILHADFNSKGELVKSSSKFTNIVLPRELMHQLYREHKGWAMVKNIHITHGHDGMVDRNVYKIKLENGKDRKSVILEAPVRGIALAGI